MKLKSLGANQTVITGLNGVEVFYSYETPAACFIPGRGYFRTETKYSVTTTRHINKWVGNADVEDVPQSRFDNMVK